MYLRKSPPAHKEGTAWDPKQAGARGREPRQGGMEPGGLSGGPEWRETRRKQVGVCTGRGQQRLARVEGTKLSRNFTDSRELGAAGVGERQRPTCQGQELVKKTRRGPSPLKEIQRRRRTVGRA